MVDAGPEPTYDESMKVPTPSALAPPPPPPPLKNHKSVGFLSNIGPDPLKNHKSIYPAFSVWPASALQRNAI